MTALPPSRPEASPAMQALWMALSTLALAGFIGLRMGWMWTLGAVVGVFVHEYGHVLAMDATGCGPGKIRIIPFLGGAATPAIPAPTEFKDVMISLAGPSFGLLAALPFFAAASITQNPDWLGGALAVVLINLFNLIPAPPLDGARALGPVLARIHPLVERGVLVLLGGAMVLWAVQRQDWLIAVFIGISVLGALKRPNSRPFVLKLTLGEQAGALALYIATVALALAGLHVTLRLMGFSDDPVRLIHALGIGV